MVCYRLSCRLVQPTIFETAKYDKGAVAQLDANVLLHFYIILLLYNFAIDTERLIDTNNKGTSLSVIMHDKQFLEKLRCATGASAFPNKDLRT